MLKIRVFRSVYLHSVSPFCQILEVSSGMEPESPGMGLDSTRFWQICVRGHCKHSRDKSSLLQWKLCLWFFTYMVKYSPCPFSCIIHLKCIPYWLIFYIITSIPNISKHILLFQVNYYNCLLVNWLMRRFWFVWFFLIFHCTNYHILKCTQTISTVP